MVKFGLKKREEKKKEKKFLLKCDTYDKESIIYTTSR